MTAVPLNPNDIRLLAISDLEHRGLVSPATIQRAAEVGPEAVAAISALIEGANAVMRYHLCDATDLTNNERSLLAIWAGGAR